MKKKIALVVSACDRYQLLYEGFVYFFKQHWDFDIQVNYYFFTEELEVSIPPFQTIKTGKGEWTERLKYGLEQLEEEYVFFMQEDMWLSKNVSKSLLNQLLDLCLEKNIKLLKLHSSEIYQPLVSAQYVEGLQLATLDKQKSRFLMSHQISIWEKSYFIQQLNYKEHPWRNERRGSKRMKNDTTIIYQIDAFAENGKQAINSNQNEAQRSCYYTISENAILGNFALPFIEQLVKNATTKTYGEKLLEHYNTHKTHDGKPGLRKESFWKHLKRLFK